MATRTPVAQMAAPKRTDLAGMVFAPWGCSPDRPRSLLLRRWNVAGGLRAKTKYPPVAAIGSSHIRTGTGDDFTGLLPIRHIRDAGVAGLPDVLQKGDLGKRHGNGKTRRGSGGIAAEGQRGNTEHQVLLVDALGAAAHFQNDLGLRLIAHQPYPVGQQVRAQIGDEKLRHRQIGIGVSHVQILRVQEYCATAQVGRRKLGDRLGS